MKQWSKMGKQQHGLESVDKMCSVCYKRGKGNKQCASCKIPYYCSQECQKLGWKSHKTRCKSAPGYEGDDMETVSEVARIFTIVSRTKNSRQWSDEAAQILFGKSVTEAVHNNVCVRCFEPVINWRTELDKVEYERNSGLCEPCFVNYLGGQPFFTVGKGILDINIRHLEVSKLN